MSGFSPAEIPILGDKSLPWFDPDWPWNLGRVASFLPCYSPVLSVRPDYSVMMGLFDRPIIEIDFSKVSAVAMRTGCSGLLWEHCEPQQVLVKHENQWLVLIRHISEIEVRKFFCGTPDASNEIAWALRNELPYQTCVQLGTQGDRTERVFASTNYDGECNLLVFNPRSVPYKKEWFSDGVRKMIADSKGFSVHCFKGDYAIGRAVDILASWGFVQSKYWPTITRQFPELNELQDYLIYLDYLYPDGLHPLHGKTSNVLKQSGGADEADGFGLDGPLSNNDRCILQFMYTQKIDSISPMPSAEILKGALYIGNDKEAFDNLRKLGLVDARTNVGRWLTDKGRSVAKEVVDRLGN
jgi:hypothetical protein